MQRPEVSLFMTNAICSAPARDQRQPFNGQQLLKKVYEVTKFCPKGFTMEKGKKGGHQFGVESNLTKHKTKGRKTQS